MPKQAGQVGQAQASTPSRPVPAARGRGSGRQKPPQGGGKEGKLGRREGGRERVREGRRGGVGTGLAATKACLLKHQHRRTPLKARKGPSCPWHPCLRLACRPHLAQPVLVLGQLRFSFAIEPLARHHLHAIVLVLEHSCYPRNVLSRRRMPGRQPPKRTPQVV